MFDLPTVPSLSLRIIRTLVSGIAHTMHKVPPSWREGPLPRQDHCTNDHGLPKIIKVIKFTIECLTNYKICYLNDITSCLGSTTVGLREGHDPVA